jgi:hypothetical protein
MGSESIAAQVDSNGFAICSLDRLLCHSKDLEKDSDRRNRPMRTTRATAMMCYHSLCKVDIQPDAICTVNLAMDLIHKVQLSEERVLNGGLLRATANVGVEEC